jgi:hypothetical protein
MPAKHNLQPFRTFLAAASALTCRRRGHLDPIGSAASPELPTGKSGYPHKTLNHNRCFQPNRYGTGVRTLGPSLWHNLQGIGVFRPSRMAEIGSLPQP